ncbi:hypothetical protein Syun_009640 [Stephania yunnanensis]|uniref:Uncharacterized protein n=1 Tax=Stephania yunnanensis TaxID=152371 RepID=A0AAP0PSG8_9MAGN
MSAMVAVPPLSTTTTTTADHRPVAVPVQPFPISETFAIIAWFRGEFVAANAIIDALCGHLAESDGAGGSEYESMQKDYSIADVTTELRRVSERKAKVREAALVVEEEEIVSTPETAAVARERERARKKTSQGEGRARVG